MTVAGTVLAGAIDGFCARIREHAPLQRSCADFTRSAHFSRMRETVAALVADTR